MLTISRNNRETRRSGVFIAVGLLQVLLICCLLTVAHDVPAADKTMRVVFISPGKPDSGFWGPSISFAKAVAEDLNIDFEVVISATNSRLTRQDGLDAINSANPGDYLLSSYWFPATQDLIPAASARGVNVFVIVNRLPYFDRERFGKPRQIYKNWIGHSYIDGYHEGLKLANIISGEVLRRGLVEKEAGNINITGLVAGNEEIELKNDSEHVRALRIYAGTRKEVDLKGVYYAYWSRGIARAIVPEMLRRHRNLHAVWSQNDNMALGAIDGLEASGRKPGIDIIVGAYNWSSEALAAVQNGQLHAVLGGHFISAGLALILMHDHYHGIDFSEDTGAEFTVPLFAITKENVNQYIKVLDSKYWRSIDFRHFSKKYNTKLEKYDFSPANIFGVK